MSGRFRPVVVGVDGRGPAAATAAVDEARRRLLPVRLVRAFDWPPSATGATAPPAGREAARRAAAAQLDALRSALRHRYPGGHIAAVLVDGPPATVLLREAAGAELLVVGAHGDGRLAEVLGELRSILFRRAPCPVLSAGAHPSTVPAGPVVVGVDTRDPRTTARLLSTAMLQATTRSTDLVVADLRPPREPDVLADDDDLVTACAGLASTAPSVGVRLARPDAGTPLAAVADAQLLVVRRGAPTSALPRAARSALTQSAVPVLLVPPATVPPVRAPVRALTPASDRC